MFLIQGVGINLSFIAVQFCLVRVSAAGLGSGWVAGIRERSEMVERVRVGWVPGSFRSFAFWVPVVAASEAGFVVGEEAEGTGVVSEGFPGVGGAGWFVDGEVFLCGLGFEMSHFVVKERGFHGPGAVLTPLASNDLGQGTEIIVTASRTLRPVRFWNAILAIADSTTIARVIRRRWERSPTSR